MEKTVVGENVSLFENEEKFLDELREYELENNNQMVYQTDTKLTGTDETLDEFELEDVDINELAVYLEKVRTNDGRLFESPENVRDPVNYNVESSENGVEARIIYEHPRGIVISEISGQFPQDSGYEVDQILQDD